LKFTKNMIKSFLNYSVEELKQSNIKFGENVDIANNVIFHNPQNIFIGNNVRIDSHCLLIAGKHSKIVIGNNVHVGAGCYYYGNSGNIIIDDNCTTSGGVFLYTASDDYTDGYMTNPTISNDYKKVDMGDIILRKHTIVGSKTTILPHVVLDYATSVGAHSLVKESTNEFDIIAGVPAKFIKKRKNVFLS